MRIRSDGPHRQTVSAPNGSFGAPVQVSKGFTIPWANGAKGDILGVPFTMGVELIHFGNSGFTISSSAFRQAVFDALIREIPKSTANLCPVSEYVVDYTYEEFQDVVTPHYRTRINNGEIINNPMTQIYSAYRTTPNVSTSYSCDKKMGAETWETWRGNGQANGSIVIKLTATWTAKSTVHALTMHENIVSDLLGRVSSPVESALIGAFDKLQSAELDIALMAVEGKETISYLGQQLIRAAKVLRAITNPKEVFRYAPRAFASISKVGYAKALANAWLEARYALRPLLMDIEDILTYISGGMVKERQDRYTYRKREANDYSGQTVIVVGGQRITVDFSVEKSARAGILAQAGFEIPGSKFGFMNWASLAFEKVKYSFILTWFIDVGGLLYRLNPNIALRPLAVWTTEVSSVSYVATMEVDTPDGKKLVTSSGSYRQKSRNPVTDMQPPPVTIAINLDGFKLLDLLSIVGQIKTR